MDGAAPSPPMMRHFVAVLLVAGLLAGCLQGDRDRSGDAATPLPPDAKVQVFNSGGLLSASPEPLGTPDHVLLNHSGAEPNIGITRSDMQSQSRFRAVMTSGMSAAPAMSPAYVASMSTGW